MAEQRDTILDFQRRVQGFCEERNWDQFHGPKDLAIGLITEASELLEVFRFKSEKECLEALEKPESRKEIEDELADCFFMILRFCQMYDVNLGEAFEDKMKRNNQRYPRETSYGSNVKYSKREAEV